MALAWHVIFHLLGLACIAADVVILAEVGDGGVAWSGWFGITFCWWVAVGFAKGWKRLVGRPVTLMIFGGYVLATLLLMGIAFSPRMGLPSLILAFAPMAVALAGRIILDVMAGPGRADPEVRPDGPSASAPKPAPLHDSLF